eukprot:12909361-Prorocentrum_lima.AAC.1
MGRMGPSAIQMVDQLTQRRERSFVRHRWLQELAVLMVRSQHDMLKHCCQGASCPSGHAGDMTLRQRAACE